MMTKTKHCANWSLSDKLKTGSYHKVVCSRCRASCSVLCGGGGDGDGLLARPHPCPSTELQVYLTDCVSLLGRSSSCMPSAEAKSGVEVTQPGVLMSGCSGALLVSLV